MSYFWAKTTPTGKPGISVYDHMVNVGCVAKCIAETVPGLLQRFNLSTNVVGSLAALHDLGKISPGFQRKCEAWLENNNLLIIARNGCWDTGTEPDHGKASHAAIQDFLVQQGSARSIAKYVAAALGAHHGRLKYLPNDRGIRPDKLIIDTHSGIDWNAERLQNAQRIWEYFQSEICIDALSGESPAIWWLAGLTSVADWIGSDERFFSPELGTENEDVATIARHALDTIGLTTPVLKTGLSFKEIFGFPPNDMQTRTQATIIGPGVYVIEAPMGMGKTEAALGAAYQLMAAGKARGIYFALPTQATSNRIHLRMNTFLERILSDSGWSRLIHGNSWLMQEGQDFRPASNGRQERPTEDARNGRDWFASAKRALLSAFGVGTVDQALLGAVAAKHFFVRHFALAGKVVILDEVHSYDIYTGTLIDKLISTLEGLGCTVIILSATLTGKRRGQIVSTHANEIGEVQPYPLISGRTEGTTINPVAATPPTSRKIEVIFKDTESAIEEAIMVARKGGAVLWICNTVGAAQKQFQQLKELITGEFPLGLLHSRFPYWRREALEKEWMERFGKDGETRCGSILVSTQVVEQSVDLDADLLITELAPTDMLLQRLGRLWRHERGKRPVDAPRICIIEEEKPLEELRQMSPKAIINALGGKARVYAPFVLLRSLEVWQAQTEGVTIPSQIRQLIELTYEDREEEPVAWSQLYNEWYGTDSAKRIKAQMSSNIWQPPLDDQEGAQTRLNELQTVSMVLCRNMTKQDAHFIDATQAKLDGEEFRFATAKAVHRNLVKVPLHHFERVEPCLELVDYIYETQCIGIVGNDGRVSVKGVKEGIRLFYSDEMGLLVEKT
ncbi:MAG: CRISPR-associated helicase Cas3' [Desulfobulbaceae bacterium]|nr:MAG: CRISPR-associated helicase Cas3' [Desulfobulbaceae bacterium]